MKDIIADNKKYIKSVIRKFTGTDNEDIEQEVYIKTWQNLPKYREGGKFKQWICTLTANVCRDYFRSKSFKKARQEVGEENLEDIYQEGVTPEDRIDSKKRQKIILRAVDNLPKIYREVIIMFEFEEYGIETISKKLKIPEGTVKSRLYNARKILSSELSFLKGE